MTDLRKLDVSLTKHGAHKIATLLKKYDTDEVLNHLAGSEPGININLSQARKTLSASDRKRVPDLWKEAQEQGSETVDALVLLAVIFSHHKLISTMRRSRGKRAFSGTVVRGEYIGGKAFTNFAHIIEELGYSTEHSPQHVAYDLHKLFHISGLNKLVPKLFALKLESAGWDKKNGLIDEVISLGFHEALSVTETQFKNWLSTGTLEPLERVEETREEVDFFFNADDKPSSSNFVFHAGHNKKKTGTVNVATSKESRTATLLHNEIQNALFAELVAQFGKDSVGTEIATGQGTSIDIVVQTDEFCWFYEIKVAPSVRACIRQALPQLLEYAYWHGRDDRADRLIIVSPLPITDEAERYLRFIRETFKLEIYYQEYRLNEKSYNAS